MKKRINLLAGLLIGITTIFTACSNDNIVTEKENSETTKEQNLTSFIAQNPRTRTSMDENGDWYWEEGDRIFVKDDNGNWRRSANAVDAAHAHSESFEFQVYGNFTGNGPYNVVYVSRNTNYYSNGRRIDVDASILQNTPNKPVQLGANGDCAIGEAYRNSTTKKFTFRLVHKASVLVFQERTDNPLLQDCTLTGIEVISDKNIGGNFNFYENGKIESSVKTKKINTTSEGFPITATSGVAENGIYMAIQPGLHKLKIRYHLKHKTRTNLRGVITRYLTINTEANKYYNIKAKLDVNDYSNYLYYRWGAQHHYWYGHESEEPTPDPITLSQGYPKGLTTDPDRWEDGHFVEAVPYEAQTSAFQDIPNVNELVWYARCGSPTWNGDELWSRRGILGTGGLWLKKKSVIKAEQGKTDVQLRSATPDGSDWRKLKRSYVIGLVTADPAYETLNDYFFLPALGLSDYTPPSNSYIADWRERGWYWTSTSVCQDFSNISYCLLFGYFLGTYNERVGIKVEGYPRNYGNVTVPFQ